MESFIICRTKVLKEKVIRKRSFGLKIFITQLEDSCEDGSVYRIFAEMKYEGERYDFGELYATHSREKSDKHFSNIESIFQEALLTSKIF